MSNSGDWDSNYVKIDGKNYEKENFFESKILTKLTKHSEKYPLLSREEEQVLISCWQEARDALYNEAQRVYGLDKYPVPTSWESEAETAVIKAIIDPSSPHYNEGAKLAREKMVLHNLRLLKRFGKTNKRGDLGPYDQHIYALKGLLRALEKYDRKKINGNGLPNKFSTYCVNWLRFFSQRCVVDTGRTIRIPIHIHDQINKLGKIYAQLSSEHFDSASPTPDQLSKASGIPVEQVRTLGLYINEFSLTSLDRETFQDDDDSTTLLDSMAGAEPLPEETAEKTANQEALNSLMKRVLTEEEYKFGRLYFGLIDGSERSVREMASAMGVPRAKIQADVDLIMSKLKAGANREEYCLD